MATSARDRLARMLRGDAQTGFSVELTARPDDLSLEVEGLGRVAFPVTAAKARKLLSLGEPARFGRGEQTLADPDVRDTWEIPRHLVRAGWDDATLKVILATVRDELGLPNWGEEWKSYRGSKSALSLVAFYADCRHEVLRVKSGYRITLTYNLLLHGDTSRPEGDEATVAELADLLREHFSTPVPRYYSESPVAPPNRLAYLIDHEYTPRGLSWRRLKGADATRAALLREAAGRAGCESILALADIKTTHSAFSGGYDGYGYGRWDDEYDNDDEYGDDGEYDIQELTDSDVTLTHWTGPDGAGLAETALSLAGTKVCASTPTGDL